MVNQNESADEEEIEHFEDIVEETDDKPTTPLKNQENDVGADEIDGAAASDGDTSEDEKVSPISSEEEASDQADEFLFRDNPEDLHATLSGPSEQQSQVPSERSQLPGGYDPRHREPSYWSVSYIL